MWDLVASLFNAIPSTQTKALSRQVVEASLAEAKELVAGRVAMMSLSEARGYIRARCGRIVRRHTRVNISRQPQADSSWSPVVVRSATEQLIPILLRELKVGVPRSIELRSAA